MSTQWLPPLKKGDVPFSQKDDQNTSSLNTENGSETSQLLDEEAFMIGRKKRRQKLTQRLVVLFIKLFICFGTFFLFAINIIRYTASWNSIDTSDQILEIIIVGCELLVTIAFFCMVYADIIAITNDPESYY